MHGDLVDTLTLRLLQPDTVADEILAGVREALGQAGRPSTHSPNDVLFAVRTEDLLEVRAMVETILDRPDNPDQRVVQLRPSSWV